eukprot:1177513-Prorocentrum_minimum.AAC.5
MVWTLASALASVGLRSFKPHFEVSTIRKTYIAPSLPIDLNRGTCLSLGLVELVWLRRPLGKLGTGVGMQGQHVKDAAHSLEPSGSLAHGGCPHPQHNLLKCQSTLRTTTDDLFSRFATCWYPILKAFQTPGLRFPWPLDTYLLFSQSLSPVFSLAALLCCWALGPLEPPENVQKEAHRSARQHRMCFWGFSFEEQTHGHAGALSSCYVLTGYMTRHD